MLVVGTIEAVMTSLIHVFLMRTNSSLLDNYAGMKAAAAGSFRLKPLIVGIVLLLVCAPLGLLATGTAWGEWGTKDIHKKIGYVPGGHGPLRRPLGRFPARIRVPEGEEVTAGGEPAGAPEAEAPVSVAAFGNPRPPI